MPRRRIGQEVFRFGGESGGRASSLNELARLIDWRELDGLLVDIYAAPRGEAELGGHEQAGPLRPGPSRSAKPRADEQRPGVDVVSRGNGEAGLATQAHCA